MSVISAPMLLNTPKGYPPNWQRVFEDIVSPIKLVRDIVDQVGINSLRTGKEWLSVEEIWRYGREAIAVRERIQVALHGIEGVAEKTWRTGCEIRITTDLILISLTEDIFKKHYSSDALRAALYEKYSTATAAPRVNPSQQRKRLEVSYFASALERVIERSRSSLWIPLLIQLRDAIAVEKSIDLADSEKIRVHRSAINGTKPGSKKAKKSTQKGDAQAKLIAALTAHHRYGGRESAITEPIGNNELARKATVDKASASTFFKAQFNGHGKYKALCRDSKALFKALKLLNGDFAPREFATSYDETKAFVNPRPQEDGY